MGTTNVTLAIRRDSLTGAVVGEAVEADVAGAADIVYTIQQEDTGRGEGSFTYVLTARIDGAAATIRSGTLLALVS